MSTQTPAGVVLLTPTDAARLANVSKDTIYREIEPWCLRAVSAGRSVRILREDFARWLEP